MKLFLLFTLLLFLKSSETNSSKCGKCKFYLNLANDGFMTKCVSAWAFETCNLSPKKRIRCEEGNVCVGNSDSYPCQSDKLHKSNCKEDLRDLVIVLEPRSTTKYHLETTESSPTTPPKIYTPFTEASFENSKSTYSPPNIDSFIRTTSVKSNKIFVPYPEASPDNWKSTYSAPNIDFFIRTTSGKSNKIFIPYPEASPENWKSTYSPPNIDSFIKTTTVNSNEEKFIAPRTTRPPYQEPFTAVDTNSKSQNQNVDSTICSKSCRFFENQGYIACTGESSYIKCKSSKDIGKEKYIFDCPLGTICTTSSSFSFCEYPEYFPADCGIKNQGGNDVSQMNFYTTPNVFDNTYPHSVYL